MLNWNERLTCNNNWVHQNDKIMKNCYYSMYICVRLDPSTTNYKNLKKI